MKKSVAFIICTLIAILVNGLYFEFCISRSCNSIIVGVASVCITCTDVLFFIYAVNFVTNYFSPTKDVAPQTEQLQQQTEISNNN